VTITANQKSKAGTTPIVSKSRRTQRRPVEPAMLHGPPFRVKATKLPRRRFLQVAAGAVALPAVSRVAKAQTYPTRPVRIIVGSPAGGIVDIAARIIAQRLSERLTRQFIVENRPGASTNIATEAVVRAPPDGYTLLLVAPANAINATLYQTLNFNFIRDIGPVASIARYPNVMLVNPSVPAKTVPEFIAYAKANPGKINMASGGNGAPAHVIAQFFKTVAGINMMHVPYRGEAPALTDLLAGQVQVYFGSLSASIEQIRAGRLHALAVTTATRSEALPDIPIMADYLPGFEFSSWVGIGAPMNTPAEIVGKLNREINAALASPVIKERLADLSAIPLVLSPADFGRLIADDTEKWAKVIQAANIKAE